MRNKVRPRQITAHVYPNEWQVFMAICEKQGITASEAVSNLVGQVARGNIKDLHFREDIDKALNQTLEEMKNLR